MGHHLRRCPIVKSSRALAFVALVHVTSTTDDHRPGTIEHVDRIAVGCEHLVTCLDHNGFIDVCGLLLVPAGTVIGDVLDGPGIVALVATYLIVIDVEPEQAPSACLGTIAMFEI